MDATVIAPIHSLRVRNLPISHLSVASRPGPEDDESRAHDASQRQQGEANQAVSHSTTPRSSEALIPSSMPHTSAWAVSLLDIASHEIARSRPAATSALRVFPG